MDKSTNGLTPSQKQWLAIFERTEELSRFHEESAQDVTEVVNALGEHPASQFLRRTAIRNFAAHVEGVVYLTKQFTLALSSVKTATFGKRELARLGEARCYLDEKGQKKDLGYARFLDNFKLALRAYARVNGFSFKLECGDRRYEYFREMVKIRDRLMHPKALKDFRVADDEIVRVGRAWRWYQEQASILYSNRGSAAGLQTKFTPME